MKPLKKVFYYYQRAMWYMGVAKMEAQKPLTFWNETLLLLVFLNGKGIDPELWQILVSYVTLFLVVVIIGKIIVKIGVLQYNTRLGNSQNPELLEILKRVKAIEAKLNEKHE